jgi:hypothetical protein
MSTDGDVSLLDSLSSRVLNDFEHSGENMAEIVWGTLNLYGKTDKACILQKPAFFPQI